MSWCCRSLAQCLDDPKMAQGCLFDGFPRNVDQAKALDELMGERQTPLDLVLELQVDSDELVRRMLARKRPDDTPETIAQRLEVYKNQTSPVLEILCRSRTAGFHRGCRHAGRSV